jgi:hypothetical protein
MAAIGGDIMLDPALHDSYAGSFSHASLEAIDSAPGIVDISSQ